MAKGLLRALPWIVVPAGENPITFSEESLTIYAATPPGANLPAAKISLDEMRSLSWIRRGNVPVRHFGAASECVE
jgi:hypothetical protein